VVGRLDIFNLQLYLAVFVDILCYGVADVEGSLGLDEAGVAALAEGDAVEDIVGLVVHQLQLDVLLAASYDLAGAVVIDIVCAEEWLWIFRSEGAQFLEVGVELGGDVGEIELGIDAQRGLGLLFLYLGSRGG
jgi:hypothetical protein